MITQILPYQFLYQVPVARSMALTTFSPEEIHSVSTMETTKQESPQQLTVYPQRATALLGSLFPQRRYLWEPSMAREYYL